MAAALTLDLDLLRQAGSTIDVVGGFVSGGVAAPGGIWNAAAHAFGGLVQVRFDRFRIETTPQHLYWNMLAGRLNGSIRDIIVPLPTDRIQPAPAPATLDGAHLAKARSVALSVASGPALEGGEWFGIEHAAAGHRVYRIARIDLVEDLGGGAVDYAVTIDPPLREDAAGGATVDFTRPACLMHLPAGETMAWSVSPSQLPRPSVSFIEAEW